MNLGDNVDGEIEGNILTVKVDLSKTFGSSTSGKSDTVASTRGNQSLGGNFPSIKIGLNIYKPRR